MFAHITINLTEAELKTLIQEKIMSVYGQHCNVTFDVSNQLVGYGPGEHNTTVFNGAKVALVPKNTA